MNVGDRAFEISEAVEPLEPFEPWFG